MNFDKHADEKYNCCCNVCKFQMNKIANNDNFINKFFENYDFNPLSSVDGEKDFVFILKRLHPPKNVIRSLRLLIPETIGFINGEAKFILITARVSFYFIKINKLITRAKH